MTRITLALLALTGAVAACQPAERALTEEQQLALIDTVMGVQRDLFNAAKAADADAVIAFFDGDAGVVIGTEVVPYPTLVRQVRDSYAAIDGQTASWHPAKVSIISRDVVALTLAGRVATIVAGDTAEAVPVAWTEVLVRTDSGWKVLHAHQSMGGSSAPGR